MTKLGKPVTQRQLRVEKIKQALGMIFIKNEAKVLILKLKEQLQK